MLDSAAPIVDADSDSAEDGGVDDSVRGACLPTEGTRAAVKRFGPD